MPLLFNTKRPMHSIQHKSKNISSNPSGYKINLEIIQENTESIDLSCTETNQTKTQAHLRTENT